MRGDWGHHPSKSELIRKRIRVIKITEAARAGPSVDDRDPSFSSAANVDASEKSQSGASSEVIVHVRHVQVAPRKKRR